jgi:hypothetical protein
MCFHVEMSIILASAITYILLYVGYWVTYQPYVKAIAKVALDSTNGEDLRVSYTRLASIADDIPCKPLYVVGRYAFYPFNYVNIYITALSAE